MAKKARNLKPDTVLKNYWRDNARFADLFNAVLFGGAQRIKPDELEDIDTEESSVLEHREYAESLEASRDNIKICKKSSAGGIRFVLLGNEAQDHIHYAMPMRIMGYDYGSYKKQYDSNAAKYRTPAGLEADEYLSRMKKTDKFAAVVTVTIYYGAKPWDGAASLHEMLDIPEGMEPFVADYKMLLVEARKNDLTLHNLDNVDLFSLLQIILDGTLPKNTARQKAVQYCEEHKTEKSVIMAVAGAANRSIDYNAFEKGDGDMQTLFDRIAMENEEIGIAKGEAKGIAKGEAKGIVETAFDFGLSDGDILKRLQTKLNISVDAAQEYLKMFEPQKA